MCLSYCNNANKWKNASYTFVFALAERPRTWACCSCVAGCNICFLSFYDLKTLENSNVLRVSCVKIVWPECVCCSVSHGIWYQEETRSGKKAADEQDRRVSRGADRPLNPRGRLPSCQSVSLNRRWALTNLLSSFTLCTSNKLWHNLCFLLN